MMKVQNLLPLFAHLDGVPGMFRRFMILFIFTFSVFAATRVQAQEPGLDFFEKKIRPVLVENCYSCHSEQSKKTRGGLLLDTKEAVLKGGDTGPAIAPGKPDESLL